MIDPQKWQKLATKKIAGIQANSIDRQFVFSAIKKYCSCEQVFFANPGYQWIQKVQINPKNQAVIMQPTEYRIKQKKCSISITTEVNLTEKILFIFEGFGEIDENLGYQLKNYYFQPLQHQIILLDSVIEVPIELYSIIPIFSFNIPNLANIEAYLKTQRKFSFSSEQLETLTQACFGLPIGEINLLLEQHQLNPTIITQHKTQKLLKQGLKIVPKADVFGVGGLDAIERDFEKIKVLFSQEAKERGLRPPKACALWGLPGVGKSLIGKSMSERLNATLVACEWNDLLDSSVSKSLANLQNLLDIVDNIGNCVLYFDEFEKAFAGWNSSQNGGVLVKMAGKLLTWMQDHESPSIMLATLNRLDMLPPELIRRFGYIWFFDSNLHNGAMWEIFKLHLEKHFPGYHKQFSDDLWRSLFMYFRGCSPAEIAGAIDRAHHELFFSRRHLNLGVEELINSLISEREKFEPAIFNKTTSNALAEILMQASFARPVRGPDRSRFAETPRGLFESEEKANEKIDHDKYTKLYFEITQQSDQFYLF